MARKQPTARSFIAAKVGSWVESGHWLGEIAAIEISLSTTISRDVIPMWPNDPEQSERRPSKVMANSRSLSPCMEAVTAGGALLTSNHVIAFRASLDEEPKYDASRSVYQTPVIRSVPLNG